MLHIVLVEPEIPQNCGNVARTCAATGSQLHLIRPLGFDISEKAVRRAGLDYWHLVEVFDYENLEDFFRRRPEAERDLWLTTTKAPRSYQEARFTAGQLAVLRQGDRRAASGSPGAVPGPLHPPAHGQRGPQPEPEQHRGRLRLRGAAAERVSGPAGNRRDGLGLSPAGRRRFRWGGPAAFAGRGAALHCRGRRPGVNFHPSVHTSP